MTLYYVTHTDEHGERHQIGDAFEAETPEHALEMLLVQSGSGDDGHYEVFFAGKSDRDWMKAALANDRDALIDAITSLYNCHEANVDDDGRVWIMNPQRGHWLDDDGIARIVRALKAGDI